MEDEEITEPEVANPIVDLTAMEEYQTTKTAVMDLLSSLGSEHEAWVHLNAIATGMRGLG